MQKRVRLTVVGRVQGVGFRPAVCRQARLLQLAGHVLNAPQGVEIELQGATETLDRFQHWLADQPPRNARIRQILCTELSPAPPDQQPFQILISRQAGPTLASVPPDLATCSACRAEVSDPGNRRFGYAFTNCTNCGPRFTIIEALPYDRPRTAMKEFQLCPACSQEYADPEDRRFDAQPNACPVCGPRLSWQRLTGEPLPGDPLEAAVAALAQGNILAIKGLGGYHLACDARSENAVANLRERKHRPAKPLAVMFGSLEEVAQICQVNETEAAWLSAPEAPVVVLRQHPGVCLNPRLSPDTRDLGVFLPYTPLHHLLLNRISPLVMTSANRSEEPMVIAEPDLAPQLSDIADYALTHNRPIFRRCDDSVLKIVPDLGPVFFRRSRGFVPDAIPLPLSGASVLACGGQMKNTFCLARGNQAVLSQHIGDLDDSRAYDFFRDQIADLEHLTGIAPERIAFDLHPDYRSTRHALASEIPVKIPVQHHHAHIAACMAEHGLEGPVLGVAWDGTGYGPDGTVWGGEFLLADYRGYTRLGRLDRMAMPGAEACIRRPEQMAASCLRQYCPDWQTRLPLLFPHAPDGEIENLVRLLAQPTAQPLTSSAGRLFDAFAALLGQGADISYEGQAAARLQALAGQVEGPAYTFAHFEENGVHVLGFGPTFRALLADRDAGRDFARIASRLHATLAEAAAQVCLSLRDQTAVNQVALSGGVFQNELLLQAVVKRLRAAHVDVYFHQRVPPHDGGLALGQAAVALAHP